MKHIDFPYEENLPYINFYRYPPAQPIIEKDKKLLYESVLEKYNTEYTSELFTIYVGIPFCRTKCNSCPYFKQLLPTNRDKDSVIEDYLKYLLKQIKNFANSGIFDSKKCGAIFFGGGTASLLSSKQVAALMDSLKTAFNISENAEITLEGNPNEFSVEYLKQVKNAGINRLSIGLQSFQERLLRKVINSPHTEFDSHNSIKNAMIIGFQTVNIDLLYGLPEQSKEDWKSDLEISAGYRPHSITANHYVIHTGSTTERLVINNKISPNSETRNGIYELEVLTHNYLTKNGYLESRGGAFSLPGHEQIYRKLTYTYGYDFIGFGVGGYSFINGHIIENPNYVKPYQRLVDGGNVLPIHQISIKADRKILMERIVMLNLMTNSINRVAFKVRFNSDILFEFKEIFDKLIKYELITVSDLTIELTEEGKKWKKHIMKEFYTIN